MKSFMKLIITVIVVAVIGFTVGFLIMNGPRNNETVSGDKKSGEPTLEMSSGEMIGQVDAAESGDEVDVKEDSGEDAPKISKEEKIRIIEEKVQKIIHSQEEKEHFADKLSMDLVSDAAKDFMKYFKAKELGVTVNVKHNFVEVMPDTDFVENMVYYFDENGDLILYESVSTTVEGSCKYYFDHGKGIGIIPNYENDIEPKEEFVGDILNRAKLIYDKYCNQ